MRRKTVSPLTKHAQVSTKGSSLNYKITRSEKHAFERRKSRFYMHADLMDSKDAKTACSLCCPRPEGQCAHSHTLHPYVCSLLCTHLSK